MAATGSNGENNEALGTDPSKRTSRVWQGRGGAGNFYEPETIADSIEKQEEAAKAKAALAASNAKPRAGTTGRGGAGNWTENTAQVGEDEQRKKDVLEAKILQDVEGTLKPPARTYHQHDRDVSELA